MMDVPENGSIWLSGASVLIALCSVFRDRKKDSEKAITDKVDPLALEFRSHRTYVEDMLRDKVAYRRDLEDYRLQQERSIERIEEGLRREFDEVKGTLRKLTEILLERGGK